jgi:hypothetical protein
MDIRRLVRQAFDAARRQSTDAQSRGGIHRQRSTALVECLADQFRAHFSAYPDARVFSRGSAANRTEFLLNELLYDVSVCRVASVPSSVQRRHLVYVQSVLWQVESEFARNGRECLKDFSKLVCGSAQNKLFVGPQVRNAEAFMDVFLPAAQACTGHVVTVLLPHPDRWDRPTLDLQGWELEAGRWAPLP